MSDDWDPLEPYDEEESLTAIEVGALYEKMVPPLLLLSDDWDPPEPYDKEESLLTAIDVGALYETVVLLPLLLVFSVNQYEDLH